MIPTELYKQILEHMPVFCIDFIVKHNKNILLTKRTEEPQKDQWWIQGGRILKNETFNEAIQRLAKREIGTIVKIIKQVGTYNLILNGKKFSDLKTGTHTPVLCFLVEPINNKIKLDTTHNKIKWITRADNNLHPYLKKVIKDSNVFSIFQTPF